MFSYPTKDFGNANPKIPRVGFVVDNNDPKKIQRVKIRIREIHRGILDAELPWATPYSSIFQGNTAGVGIVNVPVVGSRVFVDFIDNEMTMPVYMAAVQDELVKTTELTQTNYPHVYGSIDRSGNLVYVDTHANTIKLTHVSGTEVFIAANGEVTIKTPSNLSLNASGNINIRAGGDLKLHAQGNVDISGVEIHENTNAATAPAAATPRSRPTEIAPINEINL
jgi:Type VI secretion system/phage-baseplate injector OB domain